MQQEAQRDAPDPRETRPPCYSEAIRMPRLDASFASLNELGKKNKRRRKTESEEDELEEEVPLRRNRCRSEEVLSMRQTVAENGGARVPRSHPFESNGNAQRTNDNDDDESFEEIRNFNQQSANTLNDGSPYSKRRQQQLLAQRNDGGAGPSRGAAIEIHDNHFDDENARLEERESGEYITIKIKKKIVVPRTSADDDDDVIPADKRPTSI